MASRSTGSPRPKLAARMAQLSTQHGRERREAFEAAWAEGIRNAEAKRFEQEKRVAAEKRNRQKEALANFFDSVVMVQIENAARSSYTNTSVTLSGTRWICRSVNGDDTPTWDPTEEANELQTMIRDNGFSVTSEVVFNNSTFSYSVSADIVMSIKWNARQWEDSSEEDSSEEDSSEEDSSEEDSSEEDSSEEDSAIKSRSERRPNISIGRTAGEVGKSIGGMILYGIFLIACFIGFLFLLANGLESCLR